MFPRTAAAEFPNDNPSLHEGVRWLCEALCSVATARPPRVPVPVPSPSPAAPSPDEPDDFARLVAAMVQVALARGATRAAAVLPALLAGERVGAEVPAALTTLEVRLTIRAWQAVLAGSDGDFSACGDAPLDEWAAEILSALISGPSQAADLRRELRARGVAAFGLIARAA